MRRIVLKKEYEERLKAKKKVSNMKGVAKKTADCILKAVEVTSSGRAGKAAKLLRELIRVFDDKQ